MTNSTNRSAKPVTLDSLILLVALVGTYLFCGLKAGIWGTEAAIFTVIVGASVATGLAFTPLSRVVVFTPKN